MVVNPPAFPISVSPHVFATLINACRCFCSALLTAVVLLAFATASKAQPSGGPYGPIDQSFELPKDAMHTYFVSPEGKAEASGATLDQATTLEAAIDKVVTGDAIILRGGTYRTGDLKLNQGITLQAYADEHPVLKGTLPATKWEPLRSGLWRTSWKKLFPQKPADWWRRERSGIKTPLHRFNNDMVFVDGKMLQSAGWEGEVNANSYVIDYDAGYVYIGTDPEKHLIEITAHDSGLVRVTGACHGKTSDGKGPVIRGITFIQYAYRALEVEGKEPEGPADPATFGKEVVGTTLEHVTIANCSRVAAYLRGDRTTLRNCLISDTSTEGIYIIGSADCLLEKNIFKRNNIERIDGYYPSAVKIFNQSYRVVCRDNLVTDQPYSNGIWYDVGNVDGVFINNWVENANDGFFFEISKGAICAGNVFVNCDKGIRILNSSNVTMVHNTLVNTPASIERTERSAVGDHFGWHPATGPDVDKRDGHVFAANLLVADANYSRYLLNVEQSNKLAGKLTKPQLSRSGGNVYVRRTMKEAALIEWGPFDSPSAKASFASLADLHKVLPHFEAGSKSLELSPSTVFKSPELENYQLQRPLDDKSVADATPADVAKLLGWSADDLRSPGAYPFRR